MRTVTIFAFGLLTLAAVSEARAGVEYPYCLVPSRFTVGTCTYATLEQCNATASGNIGHCVKNPRYTGSQPERRPRARQH
jgi:Protein of unknown function (DUF3551)